MLSSGKKRFGFIFLCVLYGIVLAGALIYYRFPYDKLAAYLLERHGDELALDVRIDRIEPQTPPLNFLLTDVRLDGKGNMRGKRLAWIDSLTVRPSLFALAGGTVKLAAKGNLYDGKFSGNAVDVTGADPSLTLNMGCSGLDLSKWVEAKKLWGVKLGGICDAGISFTGDVGKWWSGRGKVSLKIENGLVEGIARYLIIPVDRLEGCTLAADLTLSGGKATIKRGSLVCKQARADLAGMIIPRAVPEESGLDLSANVLLSPELQKELRLPFDRVRLSIKGTAARPMVNFVTGKGGKG
jgi:type II secretion system protein N